MEFSKQHFWPKDAHIHRTFLEISADKRREAAAAQGMKRLAETRAARENKTEEASELERGKKNRCIYKWYSNNRDKRTRRKNAIHNIKGCQNDNLVETQEKCKIYCEQPWLNCEYNETGSNLTDNCKNNLASVWEKVLDKESQ